MASLLGLNPALECTLGGGLYIDGFVNESSIYWHIIYGFLISYDTFFNFILNLTLTKQSSQLRINEKKNQQHKSIQPKIFKKYICSRSTCPLQNDIFCFSIFVTSKVFLRTHEQNVIKIFNSQFWKLIEKYKFPT